MNKDQHGFFSLSETLRSYKRPVTFAEILKRAKDALMSGRDARSPGAYGSDPG